ncbi:MAG: exosortase-associated EpsI family protein [Planctomycetes bacterium]|nr:exosortase-associated EpsI family protein [Planctomycetota bacterium]
MVRWGAAVIAFVALLATGLVHGLWADRWQKSEALAAAAARVDSVPMAIGDWQATTVEGDAAAFRQAGAQSYWVRSYVNARRNSSLLVILMCGRAGRMAVHTPEVCYRGAGYEMLDEPTPFTVVSQSGEPLGKFWSARFVKGTGGASELRLYWAWSAGGLWQAPRSPRWEFRGEPFLYKLYISQEAAEAGGQATQIAQDFLQEFLPALRHALQPE